MTLYRVRDRTESYLTSLNFSFMKMEKMKAFSWYCWENELKCKVLDTAYNSAVSTWQMLATWTDPQAVFCWEWYSKCVQSNRKGGEAGGGEAGGEAAGWRDPWRKDALSWMHSVGSWDKESGWQPGFPPGWPVSQWWQPQSAGWW